MRVHFLGEEFVGDLSLEGDGPEKPVISEDLLYVLDLSSVVEIHLDMASITLSGLFSLLKKGIGHIRLDFIESRVR